MDLHTCSVVVAASRGAVFRYLADIERLPEWAPGFCERLAVTRRGWFALTALGEMFLELEADEHTGVVDLSAGDERDRHVLLPMRVHGLPAGRTAVTLLLERAPRQSAEQFERLCAVIEEELGRLAERFAHGAMEKEAAPTLAPVNRAQLRQPMAGPRIAPAN